MIDSYKVTHHCFHVPKRTLMTWPSLLLLYGRCYERSVLGLVITWHTLSVLLFIYSGNTRYIQLTILPMSTWQLPSLHLGTDGWLGFWLLTSRLWITDSFGLQKYGFLIPDCIGPCKYNPAGWQKGGNTRYRISMINKLFSLTTAFLLLCKVARQ